MQFSPALIKGRLLKRYKRFLADVRLEDGSIVTTHCPNPGAMHGLLTPENRVLLSLSDNPSRKYPLTWELVEAEFAANKQWVGVNSLKANTIFREAFQQKIIAPLADYTNIRTEVPYGQNSRIDFLLSDKNLPDCYVEIKNCHLMRERGLKTGLAEFPDSISKRASKHMQELVAIMKQGKRAVVIFIIQMQANGFDIARDIDPTYDQAFKNALNEGVEAYAYTCHVTPTGVSVDKQVPILLGT